jgi:uncharacterized protein (DUF2141 family)
MRPVCLAAAVAFSVPAYPATLEVELANLWVSGRVQVELATDAASWNGGEPTARRVFIAQQREHIVRFEGLPAGRYAVRAEQAATDPVRERFCRGRRGTSGTGFGRPLSFEAAAVEVTGDSRIAVRLVGRDR